MEDADLACVCSWHGEIAPARQARFFWTASAGAPTLKRSGPVAQRSEQRTHNPLVQGSNPCGPTSRRRKSQGQDSKRQTAAGGSRSMDRGAKKNPECGGAGWEADVRSFGAALEHDSVRGFQAAKRPALRGAGRGYEQQPSGYCTRFLLTRAVISNIETAFLPLKMTPSFSSALIWVFTFLSCRPFFLM